MSLQNRKRVLVTGGAGFIGGALINQLLKDNSYYIINLDKLSYSSNLVSIDKTIENIPDARENRYNFLKVDLYDRNATENAILISKPDYIFHLAAETHVDRSIDNPKIFIDSNVVGTVNLLMAATKYWNSLSIEKKQSFRFIHISTDEVYGTLSNTGSFNESTNFSPRSPYSASKASSDHFVQAWNHTYGLPVITTNCSNNFGPWQFPEKFIPVVVLKALFEEKIPVYGDGKNIRDWLYVEDHISALLLVAKKGLIGESYCIGGGNEYSNITIVKFICEILSELKPEKINYQKFIEFVDDRPGHDYRYSIDASKIKNQLGWEPKYKLLNALRDTVHWYSNNIEWCLDIKSKSGFQGERLGCLKN
tara:strand:- start:723 stop:1814 length:1092 start_codon:yes stop_codon:yes gene_type:complete